MANGEIVVSRSVARARSKRRSVAARASAGRTWESERISSVARALQGARRKGRADRRQLERLLRADLSSDSSPVNSLRE